MIHLSSLPKNLLQTKKSLFLHMASGLSYSITYWAFYCRRGLVSVSLERLTSVPQCSQAFHTRVNAVWRSILKAVPNFSQWSALWSPSLTLVFPTRIIDLPAFFCHSLAHDHEDLLNGVRIKMRLCYAVQTAHPNEHNSKIWSLKRFNSSLWSCPHLSFEQFYYMQDEVTEYTFNIYRL